VLSKRKEQGSENADIWPGPCLTKERIKVLFENSLKSVVVLKSRPVFLPNPFRKTGPAFFYNHKKAVDLTP
tara:strand:+ start:1416 stop:1628 length:213 start_codon:yes stop_codon:yes gene_type:complete